MVINDAILAMREKRIGAAGLAGVVIFCGVWLCAAGVLILGAVSEFSVLSAAAARIAQSLSVLRSRQYRALSRYDEETDMPHLFARRDFPGI